MSVALQNEAAPVTSTGLVASTFYQQPRSYYPLAPSRRPAIAVAQLQQGR